ncbi:hypothetical protein [Thermochromatium tepidum]|uniref:Uncharacterized protein n=1 Tax=Thermochromatium tepidum ATCC 43061 TaxID=316276 RepID=A0A6I6E9B8_THETI|nr:hypothetical protein [Thermochromatium tepidum]QGU33293.1 hypothetical protein E6P07_10075 [Thermochromatium tepidum ATCC 43061]
MDSTSIELKGSEIESIDHDGDRVEIRFSRAYLIKTMTGSVERTRWWQAGSLVIEGAEVAERPPQGPLVCAGGDLDENVYTYRDMIPIPFESRGHIRCALRFEGTESRLVVTGNAARLRMLDVPKYIEHLRPGKGGS